MLLRNFKILLLVFAVITLHSCKDDKASQIPISDFFKLAGKGNFKLSPDGKYLSYTKPDKDKLNLIIESLSDGKEKATALSNYFIADYYWTFNNQIVFFSENRNDEKHTMYVYNLATSKIKALLSEKNPVRIRVLNRNRVMPEIITIAMNKRDSTNSDVYRINTKTGELRPYLVNPGNMRDWVLDVDGKIKLAKVSDGVDETILYRPNDNVAFKAIIKNNFKNSVKPVAFNGVKSNFYALSNVGRDKSALVEINAENGKEEKVIYSNDKADIQRIEYSRNKKRIDFVSWEEAKPQKHFLNTDAEQLYDNLLKQLSGKEINIIDRDTAENKFIISTYTDRSPGSVYLYERKTNKLTKLEDNSTIDPNQLCEMQPISYKASDGLLINGYLTLPKGTTKTNLPVVVIPHDGMPFGGSRDSWRYIAEVQFLANRGYAVLQVNYRGSAGFGKKFYSAGFKQIGGKIQQDIADGVNWMINKKIANPKKIAIFGRGFGGFSALYGVSFYPKLYKCAITQNGIINVLTYIRDVNPYFKPSLQKMYEIIGNPETDANQLIAISPVFHTEKIKVPLLIFQRKDPRANMSELEHFVVQLQARKVPVTYITKKNKWETFTGQSARAEMYTEIEKFLDANLQGKN